MKRMLMTMIVGLAAALMVAAPVSATSPALDVAQLRTSACGAGTVIVNVLQGVRNDADSGVAGNAWANDNYFRNIVVVRKSSSTYCAITRYAGGFTTYAGLSPAGTGTVTAGISGVMGGGYRTNVFSAASFTPSKPVSGYIGTYNYACDPAFNCPGRVNWTTFYFNSGAGATTELDWWGWLYVTRSHGSWLNAVSGNAGDITG